MAHPAEHLEIEYGHDDLHKFDAYSITSAPKHILVWVHGGAWVAEDKSQHRDLARKLAVSSQCLVVVPNYRLSRRKLATDGTSLKHPSHTEDILRFLEHLLAWEGPSSSFNVPGSMYLVGHSCSAHMLSSIILDTTSTTPSLTPSAGLSSSIQGVILSEGIYDLDLLVASFPSYIDAFIATAFGYTGPYPELSVLRPLREGASHIRWLIIHSKGDELVDVQQSERMHEHLQRVYTDAGLSATQLVKANLDELVEPHDGIFVDTYVRMIASYILYE